MMKLFKDYEKRHPNEVSPFDLVDAVGLDEVLEKLKSANGRKVILKTNTNEGAKDNQFLTFA